MKIIIGIFISILSLNSIAGTLTTPKQTNALCSKAVKHFSKNEIDKSFDVLKPFWPMPVAELDNLAYQTKTQLKMVSNRFGNAIGTDYIKSQKAGKSFYKHTYIVKYEKHAIRYMCLFYKPKDAWVVNSVIWDDDTPSLFK